MLSGFDPEELANSLRVSEVTLREGDEVVFARSPYPECARSRVRRADVAEVEIDGETVPLTARDRRALQEDGHGSGVTRFSRLGLFLGLALGVIALDQWMKDWTRDNLHIGQSWPGGPLPGIFEFTLSYNKGVAFGAFQGFGASSPLRSRSRSRSPVASPPGAAAVRSRSSRSD